MTTKQSNIEWTKCENYDDTYLGKDIDSDLNFEISKRDDFWLLKVELEFSSAHLSGFHPSDNLSDAKEMAKRINNDFKALYQGE